jgi:hypothetical protein
MKVINGKLLGQTESDLDVFKEKIEQQCDRLEVSLSNQQQQQIAIYKEGLEKVYYLQQVLGRQIQELENNQLSWSEKVLLGSKQLNPTKLLWLTFSTAVIFGSISIFGWLKYDLQPQCQDNSESIQVIKHKRSNFN